MTDAIPAITAQIILTMILSFLRKSLLFVGNVRGAAEFGRNKLRHTAVVDYDFSDGSLELRGNSVKIGLAENYAACKKISNVGHGDFSFMKLIKKTASPSGFHVYYKDIGCEVGLRSLLARERELPR